MIHGLLEAVSLVFIIGLAVLLPILIYRAAPPSTYDREAERRQMRDERRRPPKEKS